MGISEPYQSGELNGLTGKSGRVESKAELELILLIVSSDPRTVVSKLTKLEAIGPYKLLAKASQSLHDIYLDTETHALGKKRINLRIRGVGNNYWITMKTSPGLLSMKRHERQEIEIPWSMDSMKKIGEELARKGIKVNTPDRVDETTSRLEVMRSMGLSVLQDRETERVPRSIVESVAANEILAELEVDSVLYHFSRGDVRLFETEIEAKSKKGREILRKIQDNLLADFGPDLRTWRFGKLITGEKIERLIVRGELAPVTKAGELVPAAYQLIERA